jgi:ureidoglycolate lyase
MSTIKKTAIKKLTVESFKPYGSYSDMVHPAGPKLGFGKVEFFRDMEVLSLGLTSQAAFSVTRVQKRPNVIDAMECHMNSGEACMPLDGDILVHVAPASPKDKVPMDEVEVFYVPQGTLLALRPGVWHCAPFAVNKDEVNCLVVLPERTYATDVVFYMVPKEDQIKIVES